MFEKLAFLYERYKELNDLIGRQEIVARQEEWQKYVKEHSVLQPIIDEYVLYLNFVQEMEDCKELMKSVDKEMAEFAEAEYYSARDNMNSTVDKIKFLLIPTDPLDNKNVIIEVRPGAGGDEASLFGFQLVKMYHRYAERMRFKVEDIDIDMTELGGIKVATFMMSGNGAYSKLKFESGVHRVQRVPATESQGRVHTSTVTVAVLPEAEDVDVEINEKDLKIDTYRSGGAGGQHVNKTDSAVRMTHLPSGIVVACQDERSQIKNRDKAMKILKSRLFDFYQTQKDKEYAENRKNQVGTGDRSERIRTYNFPQGRVTDHRIGFTVFSIEAFLDGEIFDMVEALQVTAQNEKLSKIDDSTKF